MADMVYACRAFVPHGHALRGPIPCHLIPEPSPTTSSISQIEMVSLCLQ
jgi:hypothetical protein